MQHSFRKTTDTSNNKKVTREREEVCFNSEFYIDNE